jgi:hypothetical protein
VASFYVHINFSGEKLTWTCAYRTVSTYLKCPSITSAPSIESATALRALLRHPDHLMTAAFAANAPCDVRRMSPVLKIVSTTSH